MKGYCLRSPNGRLIEETFGQTRDKCWGIAFQWLYMNKDWMLKGDVWKKWNESIELAKSRGYVMQRVERTIEPI